MRITVLGSGSAFSHFTRFNSAYLVEAGNLCFMIDCGSDALRALQKANIDLFSIEEIFLTHLHADHCAGLPAVLTAMHVQGRKNLLKVHIPSTQLDFVRSWLANFFIYAERWSFGFELLPLEAGKINIGGNIEVEFVRTNHLERYIQSALKAGINPLSFSVIVREGLSSFYFSSDIDSIGEVVSRLTCDLSFVEAAHPTLKEMAHISESDAKNIFFTHIPQELETDGPWRNELSSRFGISSLTVVHDGQVFTI